MNGIRIATLAGAVTLVAAAAACSSSGHPSSSHSPSGPKTFHAEARILVTKGGRPSAGDAHTLAALATDPAVTQVVVRNLHLTMSADQLAAEITASDSGGYIDIVAADAAAPRAAEIANADAAGLIRAAARTAPDAHLAIAKPAAVPS